MFSYCDPFQRKVHYGQVVEWSKPSQDMTSFLEVNYLILYIL